MKVLTLFQEYSTRQTHRSPTPLYSHNNLPSMRPHLRSSFAVPLYLPRLKLRALHSSSHTLRNHRKASSDPRAKGKLRLRAL